ncbi:MAG: DUF4421 domain-containing protein [Muribaculaceae bacterium]
MRRFITLIILVTVVSIASHAVSLALDSIREWGKFPAFVVDTYRWGDKFFNGYDTTYVRGTGYKFNVKARTESWQDYYNFELPNNMRMRMLSDPSTSVGLYVSYLALSLGYDVNVSNVLGMNSKGRQKLTFGFNCSLFAVDATWISNKGGTTISKFGKRGDTYNPDIQFNGLDMSSTNLDIYYFFNHKRYSQASAFTFSRRQERSQGSFYAGFSYSKQKFKFDFSSLPDEMKDALPESWSQYKYYAKANNYLIKVGYGYNWVPHRRWVIGITESPLFGLKHGYINEESRQTNTFALYNDLRASVVWNSGRWFIGAVGQFTMSLIYDADSTFTSAILQGSLTAGYRFNLW